VNYLLDTNVCIALINGTSTKVRARYGQAVRDGSALATSSVVLHELWYGVAKSASVDRNARRLREFLARDLETLDFTEQDAQTAGKIRADLERKGTRIGEYDTLIAGQALARSLILVTANVGEFARVKGLIVNDWSR
jgi:tRNA(fMet)-specific endonuclease VapC